MTKLIARAVAVALVGLSSMHLASGADLTLEVSAGDVTWENAIVETALPTAMTDHDNFTLTRIGTGKRIPIQIDRIGGESRLVWIMRDKLDAGSVRRYRLTPATESAKSNNVTVQDEGKRLLVKAGEKPVLAYNHATVPSPDPEHPYYARSGYIHPLYNPSGQIVTDDFNPDHAHQHGIMLAWRKMTFEGRSTNGWDQQAGLGKVEHAKLEAFGGGPVFGFIKSQLRHIDLTAPEKPKAALDETWYVRIYAFGDAFLFDITSTQSCASTKPVTIDKIHYGGVMIRGHSDWHEQGSFDYLTDEGKSKTNGNQTRPRWVDMFGPIAGKTTGTLIMDHKSNYRFPQPVRLHPKMPYFCFTPASIDSFTIQPGEPYVSRYRFYVHDGAIDMSVANRLWQQFSNSPTVRVAVSKK